MLLNPEVGKSAPWLGRGLEPSCGVAEDEKPSGGKREEPRELME